jgi:lysophospholipase L1-like esterase
MTDPRVLPLRVLVKGASTALWTSYMGGPRSDFTFPRVIEQELRGAGRPAEVRNAAVLGDRTIDGLRRWTDEAIGWSPDVVVMVFGHYESIHLFIPHWFERYVNRPRVSRPWTRFYRRRVVRAVWKALATVQAWFDARLPAAVWMPRIRRTSRDIVDHAVALRQLASPLVLVMEVLPLAPSKDHWFPGMTRRIHLINELNRRAIEELGEPEIRFVPVMPLVERVADGDLDLATPDGYHYTPQMHRAVGAELADRILSWAEGQSHLEPGAREAR